MHNCSSYAEGIIYIYQLKGKASMWWDRLVQVQHIREKNVTRKEFKGHFENKYLTKRYYDKKMKDLFEIKLVLHIIFVTPMTINDVNLSFFFRRINGLNP
jgi:hypothetical protein